MRAEGLGGAHECPSNAITSRLVYSSGLRALLRILVEEKLILLGLFPEEVLQKKYEDQLTAEEKRTVQNLSANSIVHAIHKAKISDYFSTRYPKIHAKGLIRTDFFDALFLSGRECTVGMKEQEKRVQHKRNTDIMEIINKGTKLF